jgi:transposase-like protein
MKKKRGGRQPVILTDETLKRIRQLKLEGNSYKAIAQEIGINYTTLMNKLREYKEAPKEKKKPAKIINVIDENLHPLAVAKLHLGERFQDKDNRFYLDGQECGLNDVMRATNRVLARGRKAQITNNPAWVVTI